jgi:hypothetical protein
LRQHRIRRLFQISRLGILEPQPQTTVSDVGAAHLQLNAWPAQLNGIAIDSQLFGNIEIQWMDFLAKEHGGA